MRLRRFRRPAFLGTVMMVLTVGLHAAVLGQETHPEEEESEKRHYPGIFLGATSSSKETNPSLGLEYVYRLDERWRIGAIIEFTFEDVEREFIFFVPVRLRAGPVVFITAPGLEVSQEKEEDSVRETTVVGRLGIEYTIETKNVEIAPNINVDVSHKEPKFVWGVVLAKGF